MLRILILLITLLISELSTAQESNHSYFIDVLIDANKNIYFDDSIVEFDNVAKTTRSKVDELKFVEGKNITYRIFADRKLALGVIMDVQRKMLVGFNPQNVSIRRYLLESQEVPKDKSNWAEQLNKLNLKAID